MEAKGLCNRCGQVIDLVPKEKWQGGISWQYLKCEACGTVYLFAVTDPELRENIQRAKEMMTPKPGELLTTKKLKMYQVLRRKNLRYEKRLRRQYPMPLEENEVLWEFKND